MTAWVSLPTKNLEKNFQNRESFLQKNKIFNPYNRHITFFLTQ